MRKLILNPSAIEDLTEICDFLEAQNPAAARRLMKTFREKFNLLVQFPYLGRTRNDVMVGMRCLVVRKYRIFYQPSDTVVEIHFVRHSAREQKGFFKS